MLPGASVSGFYLWHPDARYFGLGRIDRDQLEDYAVRNNGIYSDAAADLQPLLPNGNLFDNAYTTALTEPQFGAAAGSAGQIGIVVIVQGGIPVGYTINGFGRSAEVIRLLSGS